MKKVIFLTGSLLLSLTTIAQVTTAYPNSGIPEDAGTNGNNNVHIGAFAGSSNDTINIGYQNVFVGYESGYKNYDGDNNTFLGYQAGKYHINGNSNVFLGSRTGRYNEGDYNLFIGSSAGLSNRGGDNNVYLGQKAGYSNVSGNSNVFLGYLSGYNETGSNKLYISNSDTPNPLVYGEFNNKELKFNANKVGIGPDFGSFPALTGLVNADDYRLFVKGGILAEEVRVRLQSDWADYVFSDDYKLPSLKETEAFINKNKHLPNMPSAKQVEEEGIEMGNIIKLQQEKIEELTLYTIEQDKQLKKQEESLIRQGEELKKQLEEIKLLKSQMELLLSKQ